MAENNNFVTRFIQIVQKMGKKTEHFRKISNKKRSTSEVERFHQLRSPRKKIALHSLPTLVFRAAEKLPRTVPECFSVLT